MYIEISPRRAGKTQRLFESLTKQDNLSVVFTSNPISLAGRLPNNRHLFVEYLSYKDLPTWLENSKVCDNGMYYDKDYSMYFDEFDMYKGTLPVYQNGYYVTTPTFVRTRDSIELWEQGLREDSLLELLKANNGQYTAYHLTPIRQDLYECLDFSLRPTQIHGMFKTPY